MTSKEKRFREGDVVVIRPFEEWEGLAKTYGERFTYHEILPKFIGHKFKIAETKCYNGRWIYLSNDKFEMVTENSRACIFDFMLKPADERKINPKRKTTIDRLFA